MINEPSQAIHNLERLRTVAPWSESEWLDRLQMTWKEYALIRSGLRPLPARSLSHITHELGLDPGDFLLPNLDFKNIQIRFDQQHWKMPAEYSYAMYGRRRTTITSFDFLETRNSWRLRFDALKHFNMSEIALTDAFAPVSMKFITDVCDYLATQRYFRPDDFFNMGAHSFVGNKDSILGKLLAELKSTKEVLEQMWTDVLPLLEQNCTYRFLELTDELARIEVKSNPQVAEELKVKHLGNAHICQLKAGMMATAPQYINLPAATVRETSCVHKGDHACVFEVRYRKLI